MEPSGILATNVIYNLARGPFVWISLVLCFFGIMIRTVHFILMTRAEKESIRIHRNTPPIKRQSILDFSSNHYFFRFLSRLKLTILGTSPLTIIISCIFHLCLFITPIFLLAHNILIEEAVGFSLPSFSERFSNGLTFIFLICSFYFLFRRIFLPRVRAISSFYDYIVLFITTAPFITGCLAYYQVFDYETFIILHILTGEVMLIAIPFTKIYHMVFFFIGRFVLIHQHTFGKGTRTWKPAF